MVYISSTRAHQRPLEAELPRIEDSIRVEDRLDRLHELVVPRIRLECDLLCSSIGTAEIGADSRQLLDGFTLEGARPGYLGTLGRIVRDHELHMASMVLNDRLQINAQGFRIDMMLAGHFL